MVEVLLEGGPRDGDKLAVTDGTSYITVAYIKRDPLMFLPAPPPRPSWWRHPIRWFRWKPPPPPPLPEATQLVYRDTGEISGGARLFRIHGDWPWFKGPEVSRDGDLYSALAAALGALGAVHPEIRRDPRTCWVMDRGWYMRIRAMPGVREVHGDDPSEWMPDPADCLLGVPVTVTGDGGAPHIENRRYPADF